MLRRHGFVFQIFPQYRNQAIYNPEYADKFFYFIILFFGCYAENLS